MNILSLPIYTLFVGLHKFTEETFSVNERKLGVLNLLLKWDMKKKGRLFLFSLQRPIPD